MTAPALRLSDLAGPDASGFSDVAVFARADGSESEPFVVTQIESDVHWLQFARNRSPAPYGYVIPHSVRRIGRGRLVPARIEMEGEATAEAKLREAIRDAGFAVMQTSGKWSIHCVTDAAVKAEEIEHRLISENIDLVNWKAEQLAVESEWDAQAVGRLLNVPPGQSIRAAIQTGIEGLQEQVAMLREACIQAALTVSAYHEAAKILGAALAATGPKPTEDALTSPSADSPGAS